MSQKVTDAIHAREQARTDARKAAAAAKSAKPDKPAKPAKADQPDDSPAGGSA